MAITLVHLVFLLISVVDISTACTQGNVMICLSDFQSSMQGVDYTDKDTVCRVFGAFKSCLSSYESECRGNSIFDGAWQSASSVDSVCPASETVTAGPIEVGEPVMESFNSTSYHDPVGMCMEDLINCAKLDTRKLIPPGSPTKGFYFSGQYIKNYCKVTRRYIKCISRPSVINNPNCNMLQEQFEITRATGPVFCSTEGEKDLQSLRPCINNQEVQLDVMGLVMRYSGLVEGKQSCPGANINETVCSIIEPFVFDTLMTVEGTCGIAARNTLIRMIERTIVVPELKNKLDEICPNLVDAIQRKIRSLNQSTNHYGNSFDGPIMSPP